jgi:hypothetical protein
MTTTDRFEPFLEPLYIPAFLFLFTWILNGSFLARIGFFMTIISSVSVVIYELLLDFKTIKPRVLLDSSMKIYSHVRWIFGTAGLMAVVCSFLMMFAGIFASN